MSQLPPPIEPQPAPIPYAAADKAAVPKFGLHTWAWLCFFPAVIAGFVLSNLKGSGVPLYDPARAVGESVGVALGVAIFSLLPAWIGFSIFRRSRTTASVICVVMLALVIFGQVSELQRQTRQRQTLQAVKAMEADSVQLRRQLQDQIDNGGLDSAKAGAMMDQAIASVNKAASNMEGDDAACMRVSGLVLQRLKGEMAKYSAALAAVTEKSPMMPGWVTSKDDLAEARQRITQLQAQNRNLRETFAKLDTVAAEELKKNHVSVQIRQKYMALISQKFAAGRPLFNQMRDEDERMIKVLLQATDLMEENWGQWRYDKDRRKLIFDSNEVVRRFNGLCDQLQSAAREQQDTQRQYVNVMGND